MIEKYRRKIKRNIRKTKLFKKGNKIRIAALLSNTRDFSIDLIKKVNEKHNLNLKIETIEYKNLEEFSFDNADIIIVPLEGVFLSFLLYSYIKEPIFLKIFKSIDVNITYNISELYISKYLKKNPSMFSLKYREILEFVYRIMERNEKYVSSLSNFLSYFRKYY